MAAQTRALGVGSNQTTVCKQGLGCLQQRTQRLNATSLVMLETREIRKDATYVHDTRQKVTSVVASVPHSHPGKGRKFFRREWGTEMQ